MDMTAETGLKQFKEVRDIFVKSAAIMDELIALAEAEDMTEDVKEKAEVLGGKLMLNLVRISMIGK